MRINHKDASSKSRTLVKAIIEKKSGINKTRKAFFAAVIVLFLSIRGRYTFLGMERYGNKCEKTYRNQFEKDFDFQWFNTELIKAHCSNHLIVVFDPSFIPKSGKHTPNRDTFWSGCLGKATKGLEIGGLGIVDIENNTAMSIEAVPTPDRATLDKLDQNLIDHYANIIIKRKAMLIDLSKYGVFDGFFAKKRFVDLLKTQTEMEIITKLRKDAQLQYLYKGKKRKGRGRPKKYDGKVRLDALNFHHFSACHEDDEVLIQQATVWSVSLKRKIKLAYVQFKNEDGTLSDRYALYFSTDLELDGQLIYQYYKARFQIEFLFRDAKQYTGLSHCQSRSKNKIYFHFNIALTSVSVAKAAHYLSLKPEKRKSFSLADIKTLYFNELMLNLFFSNFEIDPNLNKNKQAIERIMAVGKIAA